MRFNTLLAVVPFLCVTALVGCKPSCEGMCDDAQEEDCKNADHDSCIQLCAMAEDMKDDTDKCSSEFDDLVSCMNDADDICDVYETNDEGKLKKCNSEVSDYTECLGDYCADHDSRDYCN
jgi:hypothetical protein